jgi:hypothetical protein
MKTLLICLCALSGSLVYAQDQWIIKDSVNGEPRSTASAFVLQGNGYALCGLDGGGFRRKIYSYTFWQDDWDDEGSLGGLNGDGLERGSASAFVIADKGYICVGQGYTNPFFKDCWEYDPVTNAWTQMADFAGSARRQGVGFAIDDYGYVGLGYDANGYCKDMYRFDPVANTWTQMNDFGGTARKDAVGFAMGDQGYVGTGDDGVLRKDFWKYEPTTDTWTQKQDFPGTARKGAVGCGIFPQAFICTGEDVNFEYTTDLWEFNYFSETWSQRADFIGPGRSHAFCFPLNDNVFVGTGYGESGFMKDVYSYRRIVGLEENSLYASMECYPNPANDVMHLRVDPLGLSLRLFSLDGRDVTAEVGIESNFSGFTLQRNQLPSGNYLLVVEQKELGFVGQRKVSFL